MNYLLNYGLSTNEIEAIEKNNMTLLGIAIEEQENVIKNIEYFKSLEININFYILNRFLSLFTQDNEEIIKKVENIGVDKFANDAKEYEDAFHSLCKEVTQYRKENQLTWHEEKDLKTMLLIPNAIHKIPHTGGVSISKTLSNFGDITKKYD